jgi:hypothetical protein
MRLTIMKKLFVMLFVVLGLYAQSADEWEMISATGVSVTYIEKKDLTIYNGTDVYLWVMEKHNPPIVIESVNGRIYKTKTYYLFNTELQRYSLLQIIYYDENDNVLKSYDYNRNTDIPSYKYNFPVIRGTTEEVILAKILEKTGTNKKEVE